VIEARTKQASLPIVIVAIAKNPTLTPVSMWGTSVDVKVAQLARQKKMTAGRHQKPSRRRPERDDDAERDRLEKALEIGLEDTFPASDAIAAVQPAPTA